MHKETSKLQQPNTYLQGHEEFSTVLLPRQELQLGDQLNRGSISGKWLLELSAEGCRR
jgi:hypothetical protein